MITSRKDVLEHRFKGIDANTFFEKYNGKLNDDLVYAYRAGWNEALEILSLSMEYDGELMNWYDADSNEPDEGECVLVAWVPKDGMVDNGMKHFYGLAEYFINPKSDGSEVGYYDLLSGSAWGENIEVIAWMPLPKEFDK